MKILKESGFKIALTDSDCRAILLEIFVEDFTSGQISELLCSQAGAEKLPETFSIGDICISMSDELTIFCEELE